MVDMDQCLESLVMQLAGRAKSHAQHQASPAAADALDELLGEGDGELTFDFGG